MDVITSNNWRKLVNSREAGRFFMEPSLIFISSTNKNSMQFQIPNPCTASWDDMRPEQDGRHCAHCAKSVIDFTGMTQDQISAYMSQHAGTRVCGRFSPHQLKRDLPDPEEYVMHVLRAPIPFLKQIAAVILFALFAGMNPAIAQTGKKPQPTRSTIMGAPLQQPKYPKPVVVGKIAPKPVLLTPPKPTTPRPMIGDVVVDTGRSKNTKGIPSKIK